MYIINSKLPIKKMEEKTHNYAMRQTVYLLSHNKIVETKVFGLKFNKNDDIIYSLNGYTQTVLESNLFGSIDDVLEFLKNNIKSPESIPDRFKSVVSDIKEKILN